MTRPVGDAILAPRARRGGRRCRCRGSAYVLVLGVATLVAVIGTAALLAGRINLRMTVGANDAIEADSLATSAIEQALTLLNTDPGWRTNYKSGAENGPFALGRGTASFTLVDEYDGNLGNDKLQPVRLYGTGSVGRARRVYSVLLQPTGAGLEVLKKAAHAAGPFTIRISTVTIAAAGGPLSTDGVFGAQGTIKADVEAKSVNGSNGSIQGTITTPPGVRQMPSASLFDLYLPRATEIPWLKVTAGIRGLLAPGVNPYGAASAQGIYHVRVPAGAQLKIDNARLLATLLVTCDSGTQVLVGPSVLWEPPRSDLPTLVARGPAVRLTLDSSGSGVSELAAGVNLNPAAAPYGGASDADQTDVYPAQIKGIVHAIGTGSTIELGPSLRLNGVVLTDGSIVVGDSLLNLLVNASLTADPTLFAQPPDGYTIGDQVAPVDGTWERRPSP